MSGPQPSFTKVADIPSGDSDFMTLDFAIWNAGDCLIVEDVILKNKAIAKTYFEALENLFTLTYLDEKREGWRTV
jgi:hypothetical protein